MSQTVSPLSRSPFQAETEFGVRRNPHTVSRPWTAQATTPKQEDRMDITTPPPRTSPRHEPMSNDSPEVEHEMSQANSKSKTTGPASKTGEQSSTANGTGGGQVPPSAAAAATGAQPKVVQTAFIHKLYNMLEDKSIQNLICWTSSNESFVMSPSQDFSKVLSQYFKHTNISSFVRQLNMYGFHKVSDVFHNGAPDSALWEFKHGQGNFKRGDLNGLKDIKRRASRHTLMHRDSFSSPHRPSVSQPGTPAESMPEGAPVDPRAPHIDNTFYDLQARFARIEESNMALSARCVYLTENLARHQQWNNEMAQILLRLIPEHDGKLHRDVSTLQKDISRHAEASQAHDDAHESLRQPYHAPMNHDALPISPRQAYPDDRHALMHGGRAAALFRHPVPHPAAPTPLPQSRYGSIGHAGHYPSHHARPVVNVHPPHTPTHQQHPLASVAEPGQGSSFSGPNLARRHTSADIRDTAGWPPAVPAGPNGERSPYENMPTHPSQLPTQWPPSSPPHADSQAQQIRDTLGKFEFGLPRRSTAVPAESRSRGGSPPPPHVDMSAAARDHHHRQQQQQQAHPPPPPPMQSPFQEGWGFGGSGGFGGPGGPVGGNASSSKLTAPRFAEESAPNTRRSSMVHALLNPEGDHTDRGTPGAAADDDLAPDERGKRKRMA